MCVSRIIVFGVAAWHHCRNFPCGVEGVTSGRRCRHRRRYSFVDRFQSCVRSRVVRFAFRSSTARREFCSPSNLWNFHECYSKQFIDTNNTRKNISRVPFRSSVNCFHRLRGGTRFFSEISDSPFVHRCTHTAILWSDRSKFLNICCCLVLTSCQTFTDHRQ